MTIIETIETSTFASAGLKRPFQWNVINGQRSVSPEPLPKKARSESPDFRREQMTLSSSAIPAQQKVLLLLGKGQRYELEENYAVPEIRDDRELLLKIQYIGLNPIDWKSVDFGFGIPKLPHIAGRDLVGTVVRESRSDSRFRQGDVVFAASTDYRDLRKSAYQQFAVASSFNVSRVPMNVSREQVAGLGVAFVAAVLALGVSLGCDFTSVGQSARGPNLRQILHSLEPESIPADQREECLQGTNEPGAEAPKKRDWILIWGGSSTSAHVLAQLSKLIGLRVIKVVDVGKHGTRLFQGRGHGHADLLVDAHDSARATEIIRSVTDGNLRFAVDTTGRNTAELAQSCLRQDAVSHLVGLSGLPKEAAPGVKLHTVPIKVYHEVPQVGESLMVWLEALLKEGKLTPPATEVAPGGMDGINDALDRMRKGEVSGKRLVIKV